MKAPPALDTGPSTHHDKLGCSLVHERCPATPGVDKTPHRAFKKASKRFRRQLHPMTLSRGQRRPAHRGAGQRTRCPFMRRSSRDPGNLSRNSTVKRGQTARSIRGPRQTWKTTCPRGFLCSTQMSPCCLHFLFWVRPTRVKCTPSHFRFRSTSSSENNRSLCPPVT